MIYFVAGIIAIELPTANKTGQTNYFVSIKYSTDTYITLFFSIRYTSVFGSVKYSIPKFDIYEQSIVTLIRLSAFCFLPVKIIPSSVFFYQIKSHFLATPTLKTFQFTYSQQSLYG